MSMDYYTTQHPALNKPIPEFRPNDLKNASVMKSNPDADIGLVMEKRGKQWFIKEVVEGGLFDRMHPGRIEAGQRIVKINGENVEEQFTGMWQLNNYLKKQDSIQIHVARR